MRLGGDVPDALVADSVSVAQPVLRRLAACWRVGEGTGAGLAAAVTRLAAASRESERIRLELAVRTAEPRATMRVLAGLPAFGLLLGTGLGADTVGWLVRHGPGPGRAHPRAAARRRRGAVVPASRGRGRGGAVTLLLGSLAILLWWRAPGKRPVRGSDGCSRPASRGAGRGAVRCRCWWSPSWAGSGWPCSSAACWACCSARCRGARAARRPPARVALRPSAAHRHRGPGTRGARPARGLPGLRCDDPGRGRRDGHRGGLPVAGVLHQVVAQLRLGAGPATAWAAVAAEAPLEPLAAAVARASDSGAALSDALPLVADDLRARRRSEVEAAARRVGVRLTAPLGLAFLPAFVLLGVVPVVASLVSGVLSLP